MRVGWLADGPRDQEKGRLNVLLADRAFEQFDLVDPKNRLVADSLEERLNQRLAELDATKQRLDEILAAEPPLTAEQQDKIEALARDFPSVWNHSDADVALKKRILRAAINEVIVTHEPDRQRLEVVIHWNGGVHTRHHVEKRATPKGCKTDPGLVETVGRLFSLSDAEIARILNMKQTATPRGLRWTQDRVRSFRAQHHIHYEPPAGGADFLTGQQAARILGVSRHHIEALFRVGALHNHQTIDFAPWLIPRAEVESESVRDLVRVMKANRIMPKGVGGCPSDQSELFPNHFAEARTR